MKQEVGMATSGIGSRRKAALLDGGEGYKARRQEIVGVAANIFKEKGYEAATLNDVAERLATDRASLYYYFGSKEELLHEVVRSVLAENVATAERVRKRKGSATDKIELLIEEMMLSFDRNYPHMYVYTEDMGRIARQDSEWARDVVASTKRFEKIVVAILEKGRQDGSLRADLPIEVCALALFGMINWTHRWYRPGSRQTPKEIAHTFTTIFLDGYRAR